MNTEKKTNRKEWVKNVAIIFLSVMLVLTFFSNTIMNYSLPEVATAMIEPGSITAKIRGTGNLTSDDPYKITIQESRKIASVAVKQGDVVEKDQVLFYLEDEDSKELEEAEKALEELIWLYSKELLNGNISNEAYQKIQTGEVSSNNEYQNRINVAREKVESAEATVANLKKQIELSKQKNEDVIDRDAQLKAADTKLKDYAERKGEAERAVVAKEEEINALGVSDLNALNAELSMAVLDEGIKKTTYDEARSEFYRVIADPGDASRFPEIINENGKESICFELNATSQEYMQALAERAKEIDDADTGNIIKAKEKLTILQTAYNSYIEAQTKRKSIEANIEITKNNNDKKIQLQNELSELKKQYEEIVEKYNKKNNEVKELNNKIDNVDTDTQKLLGNLEVQLKNAEAEYEKADKEYKQLLTDISSELNLGNQNSIIREQREKIAKLKENAVGATITAPIAGTITNLYKIAGENIEPNEELAVMQPEGKGFSMSFAVTPEQAKKVTVGEQAEIQNSWYYNDITATLVGIRPDPESNGAKKLLVFDVAGDVQAGQSVSLSIGQRSANYDLLVPNSAVREDNNGKFILLVEAKNSPLGNRYIATRVDVEVLGSDDNKTAISAPLYGYEYVITTATQPVEAGKQVRLAEN